MPAPSIAILLGTYNGAAFLAEQLASIERQEYRHWILYASDDGSSDHTCGLLTSFGASQDVQLHLRFGPARGFTANFLTLAADSSIEADYFAYCDQDDVWKPDKLERALALLKTAPPGPALYGGRVELIDIKGDFCGHSPLFRRPPHFKNALVQSIAGGNTLVFNRAAKQLLEQAGVLDVVAHDWWTYQLVSAAGGTVIYDPEPSVRYRQHGQNLIGSNAGWRARYLRFRMMLSGRFAEWNRKNTDALSRCINLMSPENRSTFDLFCQARQQASPHRRLKYLKRSGVYRQTVLGDVGLYAGAALGRI